MNIACFLLGAVFGMVGIMVFACLVAASDADDKQDPK